MNRPSTLALVAVLLCASIASPEKIERSVSTELTNEQISVYSFIVKNYRTLIKPTYRDMLAKAFYLEEETEPVDVRELKPHKGCLKGIDLETVPDKIQKVHRFLPKSWLPSYVKLTRGAPCKGSPTADGCFETEGTLSVTEIAFDKSHAHALVGFGVHCGLQCGWGELVILERVDGHWRQTKLICEEWYV